MIAYLAAFALFIGLASQLYIDSNDSTSKHFMKDCSPATDPSIMRQRRDVDEDGKGILRIDSVGSPW